ncbi:tetratricopeptide repeat protein [Pelagicoccus sp. SDUM812003]|uniref:tetratricopeptide repeat protein n=1 Tax=Pelagicoccus sp. SDUM812003 TaxID=3041267 RepID=UPI00280DA29E|nr:tetratricopeptide repeat protein [Pelagicoccus sp. SDUM812003]MDQ8204774.1 tetratricopeptide repeat protein [Pelagicoccus sp. SDUM812003]
MRTLVFSISLLLSANTFGQLEQGGSPERLFDLGYRLQSDESFRKRMLGSYGVLSQREPPITETEQVILEKAVEMFEVNTAYAQTMLEAMLKQEANVSATFNYLLGNLYFENEEYILAENEYRRAIEKFPDFQRAWRNLGALRMRSEDTDGALDAYARAVQLGDNSSGTYGRLAYCHFLKGNVRSADAAYTLAILQDPENRQWLEGKVELYMQAGRFEDATEMLDELISIAPESSIYWLAQSNAYLALNKHRLAARNIEVVRSMGKAHRAELQQLASLYAYLGVGSKSYSYFSDILSSGEKPAIADLIEAAMSLQEKGDLQSSLKILGLVDLNENDIPEQDAELYFQLRASLAEQTEQPQQAIAYWEKASRRSPTNGQYLLRLAKLHKDLDRIDQAQVLAERAELDPAATFQATLFRSKILVEERRFGEALPLLQKALKLNPSDSLQNLYNRIVEAEALVRSDTPSEPL